MISKPYSGPAINPIIFKNSTREHRTTFLQCLSGSHFASEVFCSAFKKERSKTCCPFCSCETRTLNHFISLCPHFEQQRIELCSAISESCKPLRIHRNSILNPAFLFSGKVQHLGSSELARSCKRRVVADQTLESTANFLHSLRQVFEKFAKS